MTADPAPGPPGVVVPRPAATVMVVRDAHRGFEVLMLRRNVEAAFVAGAHVFPGGAVDPTDGAAEVAAHCTGRGDADASVVLGLESGGLAYWVAAVRECFEEAGLLLAYDAGGSLLSLVEPDVAGRFASHRADLNAGRRRLVDICGDERLALATDRIHYFAHWITPEGAPRRYDTRFFVAAAPPDQTPAHDAGETVADVWLRPDEALDRHRRGEIELIFPTIRMLEAIGRFATADELVEAAAALDTVPAVLPRVVADGRGLRILLPGDPGYDEAAGAPVGDVGRIGR
jgi:8-oxo-dGTP pyrophosphatase MutT (NUDIX family)